MENITPKKETLTSPLHKVTPLSKYLTIVLFLILPFLGGWIGYQIGYMNSNAIYDTTLSQISSENKTNTIATSQGFTLKSQGEFDPTCDHNEIVQLAGGCFHFEFAGTTTIKGILISNEAMSPYIAPLSQEYDKFPASVNRIQIDPQIYNQLFTDIDKLEQVYQSHITKKDDEVVLITVEISELLVTANTKGSGASAPYVNIINSAIVPRTSVQLNKYSINTNNGAVVKYENETLGITFEYPDYWGDVINIGSDTHIMLSFSELTQSLGDSHFLSAKTKTSVDADRGGYWGDMTNEISEEFCTNETSKNECGINQNKVEIYTMEGPEIPSCGGLYDIDSKTYFIPTKKVGLQPIMVFSDARIATKECSLRNPQLESEFSKMIESVRYLN